jgi:hypothetical protein
LVVPTATVWAIDGDGCFQMTAQELVTARSEGIPVKVAILNNAYLGMVRQWQEMFYEERYSEVYLSPDLPDYVKWAEAMGCVGLRARSSDEVESVLREASSINDRAGGDGLSHRRQRKGLPDGALGRQRTTTSSCTRPNEEVCDEPGTEPYVGGVAPQNVRHHILSVLVENKAGVLSSYRRTLRPARLQHLLPRRRAVRQAISALVASRSWSTPSSAPLEQVVGPARAS